MSLLQLPFSSRTNTRGNNYELINPTFHYDLCKHYFTECVVVNIYGTVCQI